MMKSDEVRIHIEHDTTMCDKSIVWLSVRLAYLCE